MSVKRYKLVYLGDSCSNLSMVKRFIRRWHYSGSTKGTSSKFVFGLHDGTELIGVAIVGNPFGVRVKEKYSRGLGTETVYELRRLCCIDETPKNTESYFISKILKWLKKNSNCKTLISYSDPFYGHSGIIYKAANFKYLGKQKYSTYGFKYQGKIFHQRNTSQVSTKGGLTELALKIRNKSSEVEKVRLPKKHIYVYEL